MANAEEQPEKHCWVCFATEKDDCNSEWVSPCRCKGCTKWIHQECLQRWLDEKQKGNVESAVYCPQCGTEYLVAFPKMGALAYLLHQIDSALNRISPLAAVGVVIGTAYWSAVTYGAVTVMQVVGHKKGLCVMERADPLFLLMALPTIPVVLVLAKMIRWEDCLVRLWQRYIQHFPPGSRVPVEGTNSGDHISVSRTLCGALLFPSVSSLTGKVLFPRVSANLQCTILGGVAFALIKGAFKIYFKHQQYAVQVNRCILNFPVTEVQNTEEGNAE